jgi:geranylgeranyl pyrophosphate synthase
MSPLHDRTPRRRMPAPSSLSRACATLHSLSSHSQTMFNYCLPRSECSGTITANGVTHTVGGTAWYDHEFGGEIKPSKRKAAPHRAPVPDATAAESDAPVAAAAVGTVAPSPANGTAALAASASATVDDAASKAALAAKPAAKASLAWSWLSLHLDDGSDLTAMQHEDLTAKCITSSSAITIGAVSPASSECVRTEYPDIVLTPTSKWSSIRTTNEYPTSWSLSVPAGDISLTLTASFVEQEFMTLISKSAYWEGRVDVAGHVQGVPVTGRGLVSRAYSTGMTSLSHFFKRVSKQVMEQIDLVMPLRPNYTQVRELLATPEFDYYMEGVNLDVFRTTIIEPLRQVIDRGGKSWRSFTFLLCIDCVGGNSNKYKPWLTMPEVMHVGSLIVDDIQDRSDIRRGGPACHILHGIPLAINVGTAAYFFALHLLELLARDLDDEVRCRLYDLVFLTLRSGHAGQAFDIYGLDYMMTTSAVESGDSALLEKRVMCAHRLKSAVSAGSLARMGALVGGGTPLQIATLGAYMESIGLAFQIIDDVLNLQGFEGNVKELGEDIKAGKVTYPVAKAMCASRSSLEERREIWAVLRTKPQDNAIVGALIRQLDECGAIQASIDDANDLVNAAWANVDANIPDSFYKMMLRAFGWYVLERRN